MKTKLGEICNIDWGNTSLTKKSYVENGKFLAVSAKGCDGRINHYEHDEDVCVLSAIGAQCGKMFFPQEKFTAIKNTITLKPKKELVDGKFLYHLFTSIELPRRGAAQPFMSKGDIEKFEIDNLPNVEEQKHIAAKLDSVFSEIDKITHSELLNNKNREKILTNYVLKIFSNNRTKKEYELGEICKIVGGGTPSKSNPMFYEGEIPWATVRDMKKDIIENTQFKINKEAIIKSSTNIIPKGNVVIATRVGLGKVCILKNDTAINQDLKGIIPIKSKMIDINFLFYWFKSISKIITNYGTGLTVQGVKLPFIKSLKINLPPINEQKIIVEKIYELQSNLNAVKIIKDKKNYNLNRLRSSLLKSILNKNKAA